MSTVAVLTVVMAAIGILLVLVLPASKPPPLTVGPQVVCTVVPESNLLPLIAGSRTVCSAVSIPNPRSVTVEPYLPVPGQQPANVAQARAEVENAFTMVYGHEPYDQKLVLLQGGADPAVVAAGNAAAASRPQIAAGSMPVVLRIVFTDATHAAVLYEIDYNRQPTVGPKIGEAILDGGAWKVTRATFCQDIDNAGTGITC